MKELGLQLIPYGVLAMQVAVFFLILSLLTPRKSKLVRWVGNNATAVSLVVTATAVAGSLYYSLVMGYEPCLLCWWQRVFLVPQFVIFFLAFRKADEHSFRYTTALSIIGALIAVYHLLLPKLTALGLTSVCVVGGVSCLKQYVYAFGYLSIPLMSLTVFVALILINISRKYKTV